VVASAHAAVGRSFDRSRSGVGATPAGRGAFLCLQVLALPRNPACLPVLAGAAASNAALAACKGGGLMPHPPARTAAA